MSNKVRMLGAALLVLAAPAIAQEEPLPTRVDRIERQLRALQRTLPDGAESGLPSSGSTIEARLTAIEGRLSVLTQEAARTAERLQALERRPATTPAAGRAGRRQATEEVADDEPAATPAKVPTAIAMPRTGDAAEDAYSYGYRLFAAQRYPEAEAVLKRYLARYPKHARTSQARNLLGRTYLEEGKPALASVTFLDNYEKEPRGARAPDSLVLLGATLTKLGKPADACRVYGELDQHFGKTLTPELRRQAARGRASAKCAS